MFKSSRMQLWPILGQIVDAPDLKPFPIGIFAGENKPEIISDFLRDFIDEIKSLNEIGVNHNKAIVKVKILCFVCDAPARAYLKQIKSHNAYYGCERCIQRGVWNDKVTFPECDAKLRTDETFNAKVNADHHKAVDSPLQQLSVGLVSQMVLEPMHLLYLGAVRRLLWLWIKGPISNSCRIAPSQVRAVSDYLIKLHSFLPREFGRKCRSLYEMERWKATELRQFLLYSSIVVLKQHLAQHVYEHFLLFHTAIVLLSSPTMYLHYTSYANELLKGFVNHFASVYGSNMLVYNIHNLVHIVDDVEKYGHLDKFSAFRFESYLGFLKRMVRNPANPLPQLIRRLAETSKYQTVLMHAKRYESQQNFEPKKLHTFGPLPITHSSYDQFTCINYSGVFYSVTKPDNCVKIGKAVCLIQNIICKNGDLKVVYCSYSKITSFFTYPLPSSKLGIYKVSHLSTEIGVTCFKKISCKYVRFPYGESFVVIPLLDNV